MKFVITRASHQVIYDKEDLASAKPPCKGAVWETEGFTKGGECWVGGGWVLDIDDLVEFQEKLGESLILSSTSDYPYPHLLIYDTYIE